jgi:hypothetical protein
MAKVTWTWAKNSPPPATPATPAAPTTPTKGLTPEPQSPEQASRTLDTVRDAEDRKTLRKKTGRTEYFGQRVSSEYRKGIDAALLVEVQRRSRRVTLGEMLELTLAAWQAQHSNGVHILPQKLALALTAVAEHDNIAPDEWLEEVLADAMKERGISTVKKK